MPRKPSENATQVAIRIPDAWLDRCDLLIPWVSRPGMGTTRTDIIRTALARGLEELETERAQDERIKAKEARGEKLSLSDVMPPRRR